MNQPTPVRASQKPVPESRHREAPSHEVVRCVYTRGGSQLRRKREGERDTSDIKGVACFPLRRW
ncbi:hypothetical protein WN51_13943 [Melipona quadrifasciata]|uniref:Uncharacterized protein n=1 Tax=Melipona quadrifasciata TaxID=166423 RepID=A0A0M8ZYT3_9HYME|nr:hypothetical protein WN51_13943 [Melipona quadrifasciata]